MADEELESFRKKWLTELKGEETQETKDKRQRQDENCSINYNHEDVTNKESNSVSQRNVLLAQATTSSGKSSLSTEANKKRNLGEYEAFSIANKYLNFHNRTTCCEQCSTARDIVREVHSGKRKRCNCDGDDFTPRAAFETKAEESLVDLLIADIDEITSIPFFDLELPKEIAVKIFSYLSIYDLANCCSVNKQWKALAEDDLIWFKIHQDLKLNKRDKMMVVDDRDHWKLFVRDEIVARRVVQQKWKERFCEVRDLEYEKGMQITFFFYDEIYVILKKTKLLLHDLFICIAFSWISKDLAIYKSVRIRFVKPSRKVNFLILLSEISK